MRPNLLWLPALIYMAGIFAVSSIPDLGPVPGGVSDKSWHSMAYAGLGLLVLYPLADGRAEGVTWGRAAAALLIATAYGVTDELHQAFVPGRSPDAADVVADGIGAATAVVSAALAVSAARAWGILKR